MSRFPQPPYAPPVSTSPTSVYGTEAYIPDEPAHGKRMTRPQPVPSENPQGNDASINKGTEKEPSHTDDTTFAKGDIVISTNSWTRLTIDRIEHDPSTGDTMLIDADNRAISAREAHHTGRTVIANSNPMLIIVHPGSACGSANYSIGRSLASETRQTLEGLINHWTGGIIVVDGSLSDELENYTLGGAINKALERTHHNHAIAERIFACDSETDNWPAHVLSHMSGIPFDQSIILAGAWYSPPATIHDNKPHISRGCVNALYAELRQAGYLNVAIDEPASFVLPEHD